MNKMPWLSRLVFAFPSLRNRKSTVMTAILYISNLHYIEPDINTNNNIQIVGHQSHTIETRDLIVMCNMDVRDRIISQKYCLTDLTNAVLIIALSAFV